MKLSAELEARIRYFAFQIEDLNQKEFPNTSFPTQVSYEVGRRYVRVVKFNGCQKSVHCFVDSTNGDILKGSWKAPVANGVRGNIYADDHGLSCVDWHGPKYLR
jgi:hypothetical protein